LLLFTCFLAVKGEVGFCFLYFSLGFVFEVFIFVLFCCKTEQSFFLLFQGNAEWRAKFARAEQEKQALAGEVVKMSEELIRVLRYACENGN
jgi:hypothetical protein